MSTDHDSMRDNGPRAQESRRRAFDLIAARSPETAEIYNEELRRLAREFEDWGDVLRFVDAVLFITDVALTTSALLRRGAVPEPEILPNGYLYLRQADHDRSDLLDEIRRLEAVFEAVSDGATPLLAPPVDGEAQA